MGKSKQNRLSQLSEVSLETTQQSMFQSSTVGKADPDSLVRLCTGRPDLLILPS